MKEYVSSVSPKGQITLPRAIRQQLGVKPKDKVTIELAGDVVRVRRVRSQLDAIYRSVPALDPPRSWEEIKQIAAEDAAAAAVLAGR